MKTNFGQVTKAIVVEVGSGDHSGKVKVRIPIFHGPPNTDHLPEEASNYWVSDERLPWADVMYAVGQSDGVLGVGEVVYVLFTSDSYRHPLIIGTTGAFV